MDEVMMLKTEYDLTIMKRRGHPLRNRVLLGEVKLLSPLDIPNKESKLAALSPDERDFIINALELYNAKNGSRGV
jgi:hypothetical protein